MITHIGRLNMLAIWYRNITRVYISNPATRDTRTIGYQPVEEVDDMATRMLEGPLSSLTQFVSFAKKVQTIICRCMSVLERGARGIKRGPCRLPGGKACGGHVPTPPHLGVREHADPRHGGERGEGFGGRGCGDLGSYDHGDPFDSPELDFPTFSLGLTLIAQPHLGGSGTSYAPPPLGIVSSSYQTPPPPVVDEHELTDDVTPAQQLGFGHRNPSFYVFRVC
ncbi:hypothetical protein M9H77_32173 [Catharanthus roseus]|uniref:Uncharacterized protein n=1 Tax=Catharanthus roseus TaxID=4058 RepID=A0ACC0A2K1_CATRO|nr:hypothetical protein M9H77_32173 [Catharanthus roseus]